MPRRNGSEVGNMQNRDRNVAQAGEGNTVQQKGGHVAQRVDGDGNTTVGVGRDGTVTVNPEPKDEGRIATDPTDFAIDLLRRILGPIYRSAIGGYIDAGAVPVGILGLAGAFFSAIGYLMFLLAGLGEGSNIPLFTDYINPAAAFLQENVLPAVIWLAVNVPDQILIGIGAVVLTSILYWVVKTSTYCADCNRQFAARPVTIEYPRDAYTDSDGRTVVPRDMELRCPHCEHENQGVRVERVRLNDDRSDSVAPEQSRK